MACVHSASGKQVGDLKGNDPVLEAEHPVGKVEAGVSEDDRHRLQREIRLHEGIVVHPDLAQFRGKERAQV